MTVSASHSSMQAAMSVLRIMRHCTRVSVTLPGLQLDEAEKEISQKVFCDLQLLAQLLSLIGHRHSTFGCLRVERTEIEVSVRLVAFHVGVFRILRLNTSLCLPFYESYLPIKELKIRIPRRKGTLEMLLQQFHRLQRELRRTRWGAEDVAFHGSFIRIDIVDLSQIEIGIWSQGHGQTRGDCLDAIASSQNGSTDLSDFGQTTHGNVRVVCCENLEDNCEFGLQGRPIVHVARAKGKKCKACRQTHEAV
eukprot:108644-Rhodomonas_salina.1